jgi:hypothetical protein
MAAVFIQIDQNPNCAPMDGQVFQPRTEPRAITHVRHEEVWCEITGLDEDSDPTPAMACLIDDSGEGAAWLIFGGAWGLQLKDPMGREWGEPLLLLGSDAGSLRFAPA